MNKNFRRRKKTIKTKTILFFTLINSSRVVFLFSVVVSIIFIICFLPLHIQRLLTTYLRHWLKQNSESASFLQTWFVISGLMHFVSAASNPVIYNALSKRFRIACIHFVRSMCLMRLEKPNDSYQNQTTQLTSMKTRLVAWLFRRRSTREYLSCKFYHFIDANGNEPVNQEELL